MIDDEPILPAIMSPGVDANPDIELRPAFPNPPAIQLAERLHHVDCRLHRVLCMINVVQRCAEQGHHHVADEFVDCAAVAKHNFDHLREVLVQLADDLFRFPLLADVGEAADVREQDGHLPAGTPSSARSGCSISSE